MNGEQKMIAIVLSSFFFSMALMIFAIAWAER